MQLTSHAVATGGEAPPRPVRHADGHPLLAARCVRREHRHHYALGPPRCARVHHAVADAQRALPLLPRPRLRDKGALPQRPSTHSCT
jgi:hypothetical protein